MHDKQYANCLGVSFVFCSWIALTRFQLAFVSVNLGVSLP